MESAATASPPTSRAIAARSSVAAMTLILEADHPEIGSAAIVIVAIRAKRNSLIVRAPVCGTNCARPLGTGMDFIALERVRSMGANGEHKLEHQFVGGQSFAIACATELATNLAELARPVGEEDRTSTVLHEGVASRGES